MARISKFGGKIHSHWLGEKHVLAIQAFQVRHGYNSQSEALRVILEVVAETEHTGTGEQNDGPQRQTEIRS